MIHNKPPPVVTEQDRRDDAKRVLDFREALRVEEENDEMMGGDEYEFCAWADDY